MTEKHARRENKLGHYCSTESFANFSVVVSCNFVKMKNTRSANPRIKRAREHKRPVA